MTSFSFEFERPDLTGALWIALGATLLIHGTVLTWRGLQGRSQRWWATTGLLMAAAGLLAMVRPGRGHLVPLAGLMVEVVLAARRSYSRTTRDLSAARRAVLVGLRCAAAMCLLAMVAAPVLQWTTQVRQRSAAVILIDDSASMAVRDIISSPSATSPAIARSEAVESALRKVWEAITRAEELIELHWVIFAEQTRPVRWPQLAAHGGSTALYDALAQVVGSPPQTQTESSARPADIAERLAGIAVISDGRDNASSRDLAGVAEAIDSAGIPLYTVGVGSETPAGQTRTLIARRLDCPSRVSLLNQFPIHAEFFAAGLAGSDIELIVLYDDQPLQKQTLRPGGIAEALTVNTGYVPQTEGLHRVTVQARALSMEGPAGQATLSGFVQVINDQTRILYIDRPRYERATVARALAGAREFQLVRMDVQPAGKRPELDWHADSAVLLGDIDRDTLSEAEIEALRRLVLETGRGVALLGGTRTLGAGGLAGSALADLFPVDLGSTGQIDEQVSSVVATPGRLHPILQPPNGTEVTRYWSALPPFAGASKLTRVKPTAEVLLQSAGGDPLLIVQELGRGRTAVIAFDSTWRWSLASPEGAGAQRRFWRQMALWLTNRRPQVWVNVEKPRYLLNRLRSGTEHVQIQAGVTLASSGAPPAILLEGQLEVISQGKNSPRSSSRPASQALAWTRAGDRYESRPEINAPGEYRVQVSARDASGPIGQAEVAFAVESPDLELIDPLADIGALRQLASATSRHGGAYVPLDRLSEVFDRLSAAAQTATTERVERQRIVADHPWGWLVTFVGLLTAEWMLRRRSGLV